MTCPTCRGELIPRRVIHTDLVWWRCRACGADHYADHNGNGNGNGNGNHSKGDLKHEN